MAVIRIEALSSNPPYVCKGRMPPVKNGIYYDFQDATEEELAFWNVLDEEEKTDIVTAAYGRCFFDVLKEAMRKEAEKGKKLEESESAYAAVMQPGPQPGSPPTPQDPNQPPIQ
jgi:hypothetical protein